MVSVCVPVLKRYDLLERLLESLAMSIMEPAAVFVIDNGQNSQALNKASHGFLFPIVTHTPEAPMGVAESWNWFVRNVPEERLIANDDVEFARDSLAVMAGSIAPFVSCGFGFSCFILRDSCVAAVGGFDEGISPGYAYFEDMDYLRRMKVAGIVDEVVHAGVKHAQSATPAKFTDEEWARHHERFKLAQTNYEAKWAGGPSWDQLAAIGGAGANT